MNANALRYTLGGTLLLGLAFFAFTWQAREGAVAIRLRLGRPVMWSPKQASTDASRGPSTGWLSWTGASASSRPATPRC